MSVEGLKPITIEQFGGMCTFLDEGDVPPFMALEAQNVFFYPGRVETRPGLTSAFSTVTSAGVNALSVHVYKDPDGNEHLVIMTNSGLLRDQSVTIASALPLDSYARMTNLFGRVFVAFNNGSAPTSYPLRWQSDDTSTNPTPKPVSPPGPGSAVTAADDAAAGNVAVGTHQVICWFETDSGYWTRPGPPVSWSAAGSKKANITNIPVGPAEYTKRRLLAFTAAGGNKFFHIASTMVIDDNSTTSLVVDFTESAIVSGTNVDYLFDLITLPPEAGVISYSNRLVWWGERTMMQDWSGIAFDGGFLSNVPRGWTAGANQAGGTLHGSYDRGDIGDSYRITGNGAAAIRGEVRQPADIGLWNTKLIERNQAYRVRAKVKRSGGLVAGSLEIDLVGTGINTTGLVVTAAQAGTSYAEFEAELTPAQTSIPIDLELRLQVTGTPTNNEYFVVDQIEIKPSDANDNFSILRISKQNDSESYDGVVGYALINRDDGKAIRSCFRIRDFLYIVKERGLFVTQDNGSDDITTWPVEEVSARVGTPSIFGATVGEEWGLIADKSGLQYFSGSQFIRLSQEIQPTWESFDWETYGDRFWVSVDVRGKRAYIGCVRVGQTKVDKVLMMDFAEGFQDPLENKGVGRKWAVHDIKASAGLVEDYGGVTSRVMFAMHTLVTSTNPTLAIHSFLASTLVDVADDAISTVDSRWRSAFLGLKRTRGMHGYITMDLGSRAGAASATYTLTGYVPDGSTVVIDTFTLELNPRGDFERMVNFVDSSISYLINTNMVTNQGNFSLKSFTVWVNEALAPVRGKTP